MIEEFDSQGLATAPQSLRQANVFLTGLRVTRRMIVSQNHGRSGDLDPTAKHLTGLYAGRIQRT